MSVLFKTLETCSGPKDAVTGITWLPDCSELRPVGGDLPGVDKAGDTEYGG